MQRVHPFVFYKIGVYLGNLKKLPAGTTTTSGFRAAEYGASALRTIAEGPPVPLPQSGPLAADLLRFVAKVFDDQPEGTEVAGETLGVMVRKIQHLESTMQSELADMQVFTVRPLAIYDTTALLERAEGNLSNAAQDTLSNATREDLRRAGACLAFHQFTAAGFHSLRAVEAEARRYYEVVTDKAAGPEMSFGKVASYLTDQFTSAETQWAKGGKVGPRDHAPLGLIGLLLVQINGIYRNPIMHPEMTLDGDRALEVFGLVSRVISAIGDDIAARHKATR